jgi:hypothetical protein
MIRTLAFIIIVMPILGGCALQKPLSESIIFDHPSQRHDGITSAAAAFSSAAISPAIRRYARDQFGVGDTGANLTEPLTYGLAGSIGTDPFDKTRIGFSAGLVFLGVDVTTEILPHTYLTGNVNTSPSAEVILQYGLYRNQGSGVSLGGFFRSERQGWNYECSEGYCFGIVPDKNLRLKAWGLRSAFQIQVGSVAPNGFVSVGYVPLIEDFVYLVGVSFGV